MTLATQSKTSIFPSYKQDSVEEILATITNPQGSFNIEGFWSAIDQLEQMLNINYIRLDFGIPGLTPSEICLTKHAATLVQGDKPHQYAPCAGAPPLRRAMALFVEQRLAIPCEDENVFVTCGGTQALFVAQAVATKLAKNARRIVYLSPTYPPIISQAKFLGLEVDTIEMDGIHGEKLILAIKACFDKGDVAAICWASPNNPTWTVLDEAELKGIAKLCEHYSVIPIEDLTYLGMQDSGSAIGNTRFPSIAQFTEQYFLILSASKMLSYAGERIGFLVVSKALLNHESPRLEPAFGTRQVGKACGSFIFNFTAGAPHSSQYGIAEVLDAINDGKINLDQSLSVYSRRANFLRQILKENGFYFIYENNGQEHKDGFYLCFGYPGYTGLELLKELLYVGVTVLPLSIFNSRRDDGVRACVGRLSEEKLVLLATRLKSFPGGQAHAIGF
ncbi:MAG: pyridoxal phosphate-dependent aminotransferase [Methylococcaceae bacterium]|jgi:aspartate/methionine/tyrosine aminotransferase